MTKYARLKDGFLIDVWRVPEDYIDTHTRDRCLGAADWIVVPNDAVHGAKDNGDGTYTNPTAPQAPLKDPTLSKTAFMDICQTAFGGGSAGRQRFGAIIRACAASNDDEVRFVYERFQGAQSFDKQVVTQLITLLISKGTALLTPPVSSAERAAVAALWPVL